MEVQVGRSGWWLFQALTAVWMIGCAGKQEATRAAGADAGAALRAHEADFNPSSLDPIPGATGKTSFPDSAAATNGQADAPAPAPTETVQGFRVQVYSTANIDEANAKKAELEGAIPQERVYLEYDPPTYKIRVGNFLNRYDADRFVRYLADKGFAGAWAVPQRVLKNPPPIPPQTPEPKAP